MSIEQITINKAEYDSMVNKLLFLGALESAGVDSWEGYDEAVSIYHELLEDNT